MTETASPAKFWRQQNVLDFEQISRKSTWSHVVRVEIQENKFETFEKVIFVASTTPVHQQHMVIRECFHITFSVREKKENKEQKNTETFSFLLVFSNFSFFFSNSKFSHSILAGLCIICFWRRSAFVFELVEFFRRTIYHLTSNLPKGPDVNRCLPTPRREWVHGNSGNSETIKVQHIFS